MKNLLTVLFLVLAIQYCQAQNKSFHITGSIQGPCEGMVFKLLDNSYPPQTIATTVIKDHCFELTGEIPAPGFYRWIIDTTPVGKKSSEANWLAGNFYLENSDITFQGDIHTLPTYYWNPERKGKMIIQGSETEDLYQSFKTSIQELSKARNQADGEYLEQYHRPTLDNIFNTEEGIRLARRISELDRQIIQATIRFIKQNPASVVALDQAGYFLLGEIDLTSGQIEDLQNTLSGVWGNCPRMTEFKEKAEMAKKIAIGAPFQDIELTDPEGKKVKLSECLPTGKYVMLEFWASWCGPCRGEIPHLKHVYQNYKDKGFEIISVSIDQKNKDWQKAMKEEKMPWIQLNDPQGENGPAIQVYNVTGVPHCILLDKEGKIFKTNMRGAYLDAALEQLIP